jgi:hypothetical protein
MNDAAARSWIPFHAFALSRSPDAATRLLPSPNAAGLGGKSAPASGLGPAISSRKLE